MKAIRKIHVVWPNGVETIYNSQEEMAEKIGISVSYAYTSIIKGQIGKMAIKVWEEEPRIRISFENFERIYNSRKEAADAIGTTQNGIAIMLSNGYVGGASNIKIEEIDE